MRVTERAHMHRGNNYCFVFSFFIFSLLTPQMPTILCSLEVKRQCQLLGKETLIDANQNNGFSVCSNRTHIHK